jgi:hypothetical protein
VSASETAISRVNYFNGQRLEAADFRTDQDYQITVRRKLLSTLFSTGIVQGLEVTAHPTDKHKVIVAPGVALDFLGREIILLEATEVIAAGTLTTNPAAIFGNYLVISYAEQRMLPISDGCTSCGGGTLAWGGATRIVAQPIVQFTDTFPAASSGQIVLAQVALQTGCQVGEIQAGVRKYAVAAKAPTTRPLSIEGEKDIDGNNPKTLYFHVDSGVPNSVTLYLRAALFSSLFYTELGTHSHISSLQNPTLVLPDHKHGFQSIVTGNAVQDLTKLPQLLAWTWDDATDAALRTWGASQSDGNRRKENLTTLNPYGDGSLVEFQNLDQHTHTIPAGTTDPAGGVAMALGGIDTQNTGLAGPARSGGSAQPLRYIADLTVLYDGQDITQAILTQLAGNDPAHWPTGTRLGDSGSSNPLVVQGDGTGGTGAIALDQLGLDFSPGQHSLKFQVSGGGGQIQYNLYVG